MSRLVHRNDTRMLPSSRDIKDGARSNLGYLDERRVWLVFGFSGAQLPRISKAPCEHLPGSRDCNILRVTGGDLPYRNPGQRWNLGRSWLDVDAQPKLVVVPASKGINITVLRQGKRVMLSAREAHYSTALERGDK